jgi:uncharacterized Zn-binding protein involved in type VI secretion
MKEIILDLDLSQGHSGFPPTPVHATSTVTINGKKIALDLDQYQQHCSAGCHTPILNATSTVTINGKKIGRMLDPLSCSDHATASSTITIIER